MKKLINKIIDMKSIYGPSEYYEAYKFAKESEHTGNSIIGIINLIAWVLHYQANE
jgi:hypothetical protein